MPTVIQQAGGGANTALQQQGALAQQQLLLTRENQRNQFLMDTQARIALTPGGEKGFMAQNPEQYFDYLQMAYGLNKGDAVNMLTEMAKRDMTPTELFGAAAEVNFYNPVTGQRESQEQINSGREKTV